MSGGPLRILYLVAGHGMLGSVGPTRNVLNLAQALKGHAEVAVAFRYLLDADRPADLELLEIDPAARPDHATDDSAMRGMPLAAFVGYLRRLRGFTREAARRFDVILEKSWLLSGSLSTVAAGAGALGVPVENVVPSARRHVDAGAMKRLRVELGRRIAGHHLRRAPLVIAETDQLKADIARHWGVAAERIEVVGLGVDRTLFRPLDQAAARAALGIDAAALVLTYVGILDETHTLDPVLDAVVARATPGLELHIVGDGPKRAVYEAKAAGGGARVVFHGRVPHARVPCHIAAADLCLAPYDSRAFASGALGYSTMKVPEYLSVGRAVACVPSERMRALVRDGETGFLFDNTIDQWRRFLASPPPRARLRAMGEQALATPLPSWDDTARGYLVACERALAGRGH
jgi:glycosyltransferase involved in cell wall biosynthesis